jgi:mRNA-degrading endonuclease RelE of RelBE toxin-antitoxin system
MPRRPRFTIIFAPETLAHVDVIERKDHRLIRESVDKQLSFMPGQVTRNRKPLEQPAPFGATWELRFGPDNRFRVFYEVKFDTRVVEVLAIGIKERNKLFISGEEFEP